jgi:hypothetical protein
MMTRRSRRLISAKLMYSSAQLMSSMFLVSLRYIEAIQSLDVCPKTIENGSASRTTNNPVGWSYWAAPTVHSSTMLVNGPNEVKAWSNHGRRPYCLLGDELQLTNISKMVTGCHRHDFGQSGIRIDLVKLQTR